MDVRPTAKDVPPMPLGGVEELITPGYIMDWGTVTGYPVLIIGPGM